MINLSKFSTTVWELLPSIYWLPWIWCEPCLGLCHCRDNIIIKIRKFYVVRQVTTWEVHESVIKKSRIVDCFRNHFLSMDERKKRESVKWTELQGRWLAKWSTLNMLRLERAILAMWCASILLFPNVVYVTLLGEFLWCASILLYPRHTNNIASRSFGLSIYHCV